MLASSLAWPPVSLDLLVTAAGTPIPCNKAALTAGSAYFSAQLELNPPPLTIDLPSVPAEVFTKLLACLYTGKLDCTADSVYPLFWYAQMLQMPGAVLQCSQFLASLTSPNPPPPTPSASPPSTKPIVVKPIASRGVPLLPTPDLHPTPAFLRPHLASFYSDWFLRYSTFSTLTRNSAQESQENESAAPSSSSRREEELGSAGASPKTFNTLLASTNNSLLDTASCDGPVKFHRIINKFFSVDFPKQAKREEETEVKEDEADETNETGETYSCIYCNHVFKSHYCYQKHKRRHINPVTVDLQGNEQDKKLLVMKDLNVQYFPCKICGAKFPSYYFVHKHKKLWHRAQLELEQELEQQQQKLVDLKKSGGEGLGKSGGEGLERAPDLEESKPTAVSDQPIGAPMQSGGF